MIIDYRRKDLALAMFYSSYLTHKEYLYKLN